MNKIDTDNFIEGDKMLESIITFIKIMFLSEVLLLTSEPISINGSHTLLLKKELNVITKGANLELEISKFLKEKDKNRNYFHTGISDIIPPKSITADMYYNNEKIITLELTKSIGFGKEKTYIYLKNIAEIKSTMKFNKIIVKSEVNLNKIQIRWSNASM